MQLVNLHPVNLDLHCFKPAALISWLGDFSPLCESAEPILGAWRFEDGYLPRYLYTPVWPHSHQA